MNPTKKARQPEVAMAISIEEITAYANLLRGCIAIMEEAGKLIQNGKLEATFAKASKDNSVRFINSFKQQIDYSVYRSNSGNPVKVGERKPRSDPQKGETISPAAAKAAIDRKTTKKK